LGSVTTQLKPFLKMGEFELPEKWCIKRTEETDKTITEWINKEYNTDYRVNNLRFPWIPNRANDKRAQAV